MTDDPAATVRWERLLPREFVRRQQESPWVYLPLGLCEPHGHAAAFGLDTLKAVWLCEQAARRLGGVVAPTQGYQIHEVGYHRPWLADMVGDVVPRMTSIPPDVLLRMLVFQLRSFVNAGFRGVVVVTGHHGNQPDLRLVAEELVRVRPLPVVVVSDPELVQGTHRADHAGRYELSQLLHIDPRLVDLDRLGDAATSPLGRFAQGEDAAEASAELGRAILEESLAELGRLVAEQHCPAQIPPLSIAEAEEVWSRVAARSDEWWTLRDWHPEHGTEPTTRH